MKFSNDGGQQHELISRGMADLYFLFLLRESRELEEWGEKMC